VHGTLKGTTQVILTAIHSGVLICWFVFITPTLFSQLHTLDVSQYQHASWTAQEGFFRGGITSVAQTSDGYLWLNSTAGLLRFDGVRFVEWKPPGNDSLPPPPLKKVLGSKDGSLWIGGKGLAELTASGEFHRYHQLDGLDVFALVEDQDGAIWAGGEARPGSAPLCRVYHRQSECYGDAKFMEGWVNALYNDKEGRLWASSGDGIWRLRPGQPKKLIDLRSQTGVFAEDASGSLLFSNGVEIKTFTADGKSKDYQARIDGKPIRAWGILKDRDGNLWIGTDGQGVVHIHEGRMDQFTTLDGLSYSVNLGIFQDHEGNVWVASGNGLDRFTKPAVPRLTRKQGLSDENVISVLTDPHGVTWIGTAGGFNELTGDHLSAPKAKLPSEIVTSLFETFGGRMLLATDTANGMVWLEGSNVVPLKAPSGPGAFQIAEDHHGDLWVVNGEGLLHLRQNGDLIKLFSRKDLGNRPMLVAIDPKRDGLWLTDTLGDLWLFKDGKVIERYGPADGLGDRVLRDPQVDDDGSVWVGTGNGLARVMNGRIAVLGRKNGLPCDAVLWMRHDEDHNVWLYTECGLVSFSESDLSAWIAQPSHIVTIKHYLDNTDGVVSVPYGGWYTPQTAETSDGRILFASPIGLSVLDPRNLNQNTLPPPVHIEEVTVDGREIKKAGQVSLPERPRTLHLMFTALSFVTPRKVRFRYKLEGYDKDWSDPVTVREATYTNLPPGRYQFHVIASNNDGVWNEAGASLAFSVAPAWFQTNWFRFVCIGAFLALLWGLYQLRLQQLRGQFNVRLEASVHERTRIARELHDTLLQSLHGLMFEFQAARNMFRKRPEEALQALDGAIMGTEQAITESQDAIENLRAATVEDDLAQLIKVTGENLAAARNGENNSPTFGLIVEGQQRALNPAIRDEIYRIAREVLRNAFRHSQARRVEAEILYDEDQFRLRVRDDGKGMDALVLEKGSRPGHWGLPGVRERAQKIGAKLDVWSEAGAGTEVQLAVLAAAAYQKTVGRSRFKFFQRIGNHEHQS
jgi:signal transduction histidine kinase/ligand-binding sensor domain-containing protein